MTWLVLIAPLLVFTLSVACLVPVMQRLFRACRFVDVSPEWLEDFAVSAYYPMEGLLSSEDFNFLSRQPGFDLSLYKKFRKDRLQIFRQYLNRMIADFNRLHVVARYVLANTPEDHSDLLKQLVWIKIRFSLAVLQAEMNYLLCCIGFQTLTARTLIVSLEAMSVRLNSIHAVQSAEVFV